MSSRGNRTDSAGDLADAPFIDDEERAEARWLLARDTDPTAPATSESVARDYERLENLLDTMPAGPMDDSWQEDVLKAAASRAGSERLPRRRLIHGWTRWALGGAVAAAAVLVVILRLPRPPELEISIRHGGKARGHEAAVVGDHLVVEAHVKGGSGDLRVFEANGMPVAKCPGGPGCNLASGERYVIDLPLQKLVQYQVILVVGDAAAVARLPDGAMRGYLQAASASDARIVTYGPIDVH